MVMAASARSAFPFALALATGGTDRLRRACVGLRTHRWTPLPLEVEREGGGSLDVDSSAGPC